MDNKLATPYLEWALAERHFNYLDDYANVIEVYENFRSDMPDVIIDQNGKIEELFTRIPALARYYAKEKNSNTYIRNKQLVPRAADSK
jgi:deoxyadenosine/deoxycytidine kinase